MAAIRQILLVTLTLVWGGGTLFAASRESREYTAAAAAFNDGIFDRAETELARFVNDFPDSDHVAEAVLLKGEAQYQQGKFAEAAATLAAPAGDWAKLADQYAYWLGEAQYGQGDFKTAATTFTNLTGQFPKSSLCLASVVAAAAAYEKLADWTRLVSLLDAPDGVFASAAKHNGAGELVSRGRLLLARAQLAQGKFAAAQATLQSLTPSALSLDLNWQRVNLLCQVELGADDLGAALAASANLVDLARQPPAAPARLAESLALRGTILGRLQRWPEAADVWAQNLTNSAAPVEWQRQAVLKLAEAALARQNYTNAMASLSLYLEQFTNAPAANLARLTLGELSLRQYAAVPADTNYLAGALATFDDLLATNSDAGDLAGKAHLDRGWCYWVAGNTNASLADFQAAAQRLPLSEDLAVAKFKTGDALFALHDYAAARASYQAVLKEFAGWPKVMTALGNRALYQVIRTSVNLRDKATAEAAMQQLLEQFPKNDINDNAELVLGEGLFTFDAATNAAAVFRDFAGRFPDSPLRPQAELDVARTYERSRNWPEAIASYQGWLTNYPADPLRPQVEYALGHAEFQAGHETNALAQFDDFVQRYPTNALAPLAQWWVADHYFRLGGTNYAEAEKNYEYIFQNTNAVWQNSELFYPAQLMAGRAAAGRSGFPDAARYFTAMVSDTNCPGPLQTQARFAYGSVLMRMDSPDTNRPYFNFELATNVFTKLGADNPTNDLGALASSELADCDLQLGAFDAATNAYTQVIRWPGVSVGLRSRARVGLGRVLEKMAELAPVEERKALLTAARNQYLNVVETAYGVGLNDHESASAFWVKKAGLLALPLLSNGDGYPTNFFNTLETLLPQLTETLEKKRAALQN